MFLFQFFYSITFFTDLIHPFPQINGTSDQHSGVENLDVGKTPKHEQKSSDEKSVKVR